MGDVRRSSSLCLVRRGGAGLGYRLGEHRTRRYRLVGRKGAFSPRRKCICIFCQKQCLWEHSGKVTYWKPALEIVSLVFKSVELSTTYQYGSIASS